MKRSVISRLLVVGLTLVLLAVVFFVGKALLNSGATTGSTASGQIWTCSMHPQVRLPRPGKCPLCSMPLIPARPLTRSTNAAAGLPATNGMSPPHLELSEHARAMASVETVLIGRREIHHELRAVGKVQYNETALANITTRVEGYIERLFVDYTGVEVKAGDHLVEIYSPDLLVAQQELLIALESQRNASLVESARRKLLLWGLTESQVDDLVRTKKISDRITLFSPIQGTVTEKLVVQKAMVKPGEMLYRLANLESVWVSLDIYEYELPWVQYGQRVEIKSEALPGQEFSGRVWFISPVLNEESRTIKVLLNIANTGRKLKPGMYVSAMLRAELLADGSPAPTGVEGQWSCPMHPLVVVPQPGDCPDCKMKLVQIPGAPRNRQAVGDSQLLAVPASAVLDSGMRTLVYVERSQGHFEPVEVKLGARAGGFYPVLSGLNGGERVAVRGNFLLDSQFQIQGLPSLLYAAGAAGTSGHSHGQTTPAPARPLPKGHEGHESPKAPQP